MIDGHDVRHFLTVARGRSAPGAPERLGVNQSTVLRRIVQLEARPGVHMFEKLPSGYRLTAAGEEVLKFVNQREAASHLLKTQVIGLNQNVRGTAGDVGADTRDTSAYAELPAFAHPHPDIEVTILVRRPCEFSSPRCRRRDPPRLRPKNFTAHPSVSRYQYVSSHKCGAK